MQAGAAMAVVGWWTGYKLGGVVALKCCRIFSKIGFENYWQITFLILGIVIIACNIGLMFINETFQTEEKNLKKNR
jgi:PAT family beta-lactamase induction signal transducer AmpG